MPSKLNACLLSAVMLAALMHCAPGAPLEDPNPAGDPSGDLSGDPSAEEGESSSDQLRHVWQAAIAATEHHQQQFEEEFQNTVQYIFLRRHSISSLPQSCPNSNTRKEAYLHRLVQGLLTYTVLLKHVEKEYPLEAQIYSSHLIKLISVIKEKMKSPEQITALTSSQEEQLLTDIDSPDTFNRKMTAHSIVCSLRDFLVDCKRLVIDKREKPRGSMTLVSFYPQNLKR